MAIPAGIRADKSNRLTFPCGLHSGIERPAAAKTRDACLPLRGQHTLAKWLTKAPCFPFNCTHEHAREHQKAASVRASYYPVNFDRANSSHPTWSNTLCRNIWKSS